MSAPPLATCQRCHVATDQALERGVCPACVKEMYAKVLQSVVKTDFVVSEATRMVLKQWLTAPDSVFLPAHAEMLTAPAFEGGNMLGVPPFADPLVQPMCVDHLSPEFWLVDMQTGELFACKLNQAWSFDEMINVKPVFTRVGDTFEMTGVEPKAPHKGGCCGLPRSGGVGNNQMLHPTKGYVMCVLCMGPLRPGQFNRCDGCSR